MTQVSSLHTMKQMEPPMEAESRPGRKFGKMVSRVTELLVKV